MDITKFGLQNFRVFKEHFDFELAPIMVLTGPNNSGKSSVSKALLLLKENEGLINAENHMGPRLNYFRGNHDLGNHNYIINTREENTIFSFTFLLDYKFCIEIDKGATYVYDYKITNRDGELVIAQRDGLIKINVSELICFFKDRIVTETYKDSFQKKLDHIHSGAEINYKKIEKFISTLEEVVCEIQYIEVDLWDAFSYTEEEIIKKQKLAKENLSKGIFSPVLNLISEIVHIDEDSLDTDRQASLIYLFHVITNIELTGSELDFLIPPSIIDFFSFQELVYIHTFKEPLKRSYTTNDNLVFQNIIRNEIIKNRDEDFRVENDIKIITSDEQTKSLGYFYQSKKIYENFIRKWIKEFEIGKELSFGYEEMNDIYFIKVDGKSLLEYGLGYGLIIHILLALNNEADTFYRKKKKLNFPVTYIIEEPETGLHPAFQSKIAEMIVDIQKTFNVNIIVETHSEYFIRKLQYLTATKEINSGDAVIYYFNNPKKIPEGEEQIKKITIENDGSLTDNFGPGFIDEGTNLKFELLRLNKSRQN